MDIGAYHLAIDNGRETPDIPGQNVWSSIECGMTIFMNVVLVLPAVKDWRQCPICRTRNYLRDGSDEFTID